MTISRPYSIAIYEDGRSGSMTCRQGVHSVEFYWEFGGGDVVVIIQVSDKTNWASPAAWFADRRTELLQVVAAEAIRQRAPGCHADIDEPAGTILLRQGPSPAVDDAKPSTKIAHVLDNRVLTERSDTAFVRRYANIRAMFAIGVLIVVLIVAVFLFVGRNVLMVAPASGVPLGETVRTEHHIASLIQTTDPHLPNWSGRGGDETTSISILLIPMDGSQPQLIPVVSGISGSGHSLARILGSDGHTLWFDATGLFGVRQGDYSLVKPVDLQKKNGSLDPSWWADARGMDIVDGKLHVMRADRSAAIDVDPSTWTASLVAPRPSNARFERHEPTDFFAAGFVTASANWLGLHSAEELNESFKPGKWLRPVERATDAKQQRRLCTAELEPSSERDYFQVRSIAPIGDAEYRNAAFLRMDKKSVPVRLMDPDGALMIYTSEPGLKGTVIVARVDLDGAVRWKADTGIERFQLQQILPGKEAFAFVGKRPQVPDKLSEPLVVLIENAAGEVDTHSLWR